jgi:hypothetical protein
MFLWMINLYVNPRNTHTVCQDKKAQVKSHFESQPADAKPLVFDHTPHSYARVELGPSPPRGTSGPENKDQSLCTQSLPQRLSCNDQGQCSKRPTLPDQLWALFMGIRILIHSLLFFVNLSLLGRDVRRPLLPHPFVLDAPGNDDDAAEILWGIPDELLSGLGGLTIVSSVD